LAHRRGTKDSFFRTTRQLWKLIVGALVLPLPTALWGWWSLRQMRPDQPASEVSMHLGILVGAAITIGGLLASIHCPKCKARLMKRIMQAPEGLEAVPTFLRLRTCPSCGYDPTAAGVK
jgi:hypothetical protein